MYTRQTQPSPEQSAISKIKQNQAKSRTHLEISVADPVGVQMLQGERHLPAVHPRRLQVHLHGVPPEQLEQIRTGKKIKPVVQELSLIHI